MNRLEVTTLGKDHEMRFRESVEDNNFKTLNRQERNSIRSSY